MVLIDALDLHSLSLSLSLIVFLALLRQSEVTSDKRWQNLENTSNSMTHLILNMVLSDASASKNDSKVHWGEGQFSLSSRWKGAQQRGLKCTQLHPLVIMMMTTIYILWWVSVCPKNHHFLVFHGFWLVSMVFKGGFMVFHGFWLVSKVFKGGFMVFHVFWLVSMVFKGGFMVCLSVTKNHHFLLGVSCNHLNPP